MKKLLMSAIVAGTLASSASAWDWCSTESQIGVVAGSMGTGMAVVSGAAGGVPGLIVGAVLNQWLCDATEPQQNTESTEPKTLTQTELKTTALAEVQTIYFDFDSVVLDEEAKADIEDNTDVIKLTQASIRIEGNADSRGSDEYNYALALKRAETVKSRLISNGVTNPLEVISYGEAKPVCAESTEDCFDKNRRVEFRIAD